MKGNRFLNSVWRIFLDSPPCLVQYRDKSANEATSPGTFNGERAKKVGANG
jgi:hypothetical protein